jgi:succinate dehydrogenase assembly factor 1
MSNVRHSKLQLQVLSLYKQCLRVAQTKAGFQETVRMEFRRNAAVPRTDILRIEQLMRGGYRQNMGSWQTFF